MARLEPKLLTEAELAELFAPGKEGDSSSVTIDRWIRCINGGNAHLLAGGTLTKDQQENIYFYQEKLDDWRSDYYGQAGL
jgi:hypothetical protein